MSTLVLPPASTFARSSHLSSLFDGSLGGLPTDRRWCAIVQIAGMNEPPPPLPPVAPGLTRQERTFEVKSPYQRYRAWVTLVYGVPRMQGQIRPIPVIDSPHSGLIRLPRGSYVVIWENPTPYHTVGITNAAWRVARMYPPPPQVRGIRGAVTALGPGVFEPRRLDFTVWVGIDLQISAQRGSAPLWKSRPRVIVLPRSNTELMDLFMASHPAAIILDDWFGYLQLNCGVRIRAEEAHFVLPSGASAPLGPGFSAVFSGPREAPALTSAMAYGEWFRTR